MSQAVYKTASTLKEEKIRKVKVYIYRVKKGRGERELNIVSGNVNEFIDWSQEFPTIDNEKIYNDLKKVFQKIRSSLRVGQKIKIIFNVETFDELDVVDCGMGTGFNNEIEFLPMREEDKTCIRSMYNFI